MLTKISVAKETIMALDVGEKRIGVALADSEVRLPRPLTTLTVSDATPREIKHLLDEYKISRVVVGRPRNQAGSPTQQTSLVEVFVDKIKLPGHISISWQDESLTSVKAEDELKSRRKQYRKSDIDALAATYILEDYLKENF